MYITGHHAVFKKDEVFKTILKYTDFTSIEYLGEIYDKEQDKKNKKSRSIFRCSREMYNKQNFQDSIHLDLHLQYIEDLVRNSQDNLFLNKKLNY